MSKRVFTWFLVVSFFFLLSLPAVSTLFGIYQHNEFFPGSEDVPQPTFQLKSSGLFSLSGAKDIYVSIIDYKYEYARYFNNHYLAKYKLFDVYRLVVQDLLATEPMPQKVVEGENDMMFCGNWHTDYLYASKGFLRFDSSEVNVMANEISRQSAWCNKHGIAYFFAVAPNKLTIYGENLPIVNYGNSSLRELIGNAVNKSVNYLDFTPTLLANKHEFQLYHNDDTHWNQLGAYNAYVELMRQIQFVFPEVTIIGRENYQLDSIVGLQNDIVRQIRMETDENQYILRRVTLPKAVVLNRVYRPEVKGVIGDYQFDYKKRYANSLKPLKVLIFRDSFGCAMVEFIRESFGSSVIVWDNTFDTTMIMNEKPDIVLNMVVERHLDSKLGKH